MHCGEATDLFILYVLIQILYIWRQPLKMSGSVSRTAKFYSSDTCLVYVLGGQLKVTWSIDGSGFEWFLDELLGNWMQMLSINVIVTIEDCWQPILNRRCSLSSTPSAYENQSRAQPSCKN